MKKNTNKNTNTNTIKKGTRRTKEQDKFEKKNRNVRKRIGNDKN